MVKFIFSEYLLLLLSKITCKSIPTKHAFISIYAVVNGLCSLKRAMQPLLNILPCQWFLNPLNPNIQIQILQTGLYTFP